MKHFTLAVSAAALLFTGAAQAAVVAGPTVNGITTFTDTTTNTNWARLDNFFGLSHNSMAALVTAAGFTVAVRSDVEGLLGTLPLSGGEWDGYEAIMGGAPNREIIWGSYGPPDALNLVGWAYAYEFDDPWEIFDSQFSADGVPNEGGEFADANIWAYVGGGGGVIPEPATWGLMIAGFGLVGFAARRRTAITAA